MQVALAGVAAAALLTAQVPASYAAGVTSAPSSAVSNSLSSNLLCPAHPGLLTVPTIAVCDTSTALWQSHRMNRFAHHAGFLDACADNMRAMAIGIAVQAPSGVKKVVCASNPTSKICLKDSFAKK